MSHRQLLSRIAVAALGVSAVLAAAATPPGGTAYRMIARYPIGGNDTGYDYLRVDAPTRRVFIAHATRVEVLNADTGQKVGEIAGIQGAHGIEIVESLNKGYITGGLDRAVTVFDRNTLKVLHVIKGLGVKPDAIQYDAETHRLFVVNGGATGDVTLIDPSNDSIVGTVNLQGSKLEQIGFDGHGHAFVNDESKNVIHVFDTHSLKPTATWTLGGCEEPTGMAVDREHSRVFAACGNEKLAVLDTNDGHVVAVPTIGSDPDGAVFNPKTQQIFTSNREGTLSVLHEVSPDRYETLQTLKTEPGARTLALDEKTDRIFMPTARMGATPAGGGRAPIVPETFVLLAAGH
jgi:DNA-binding beta-propeller fold protein YncE